ncbi:uncharacterized protein [Medicago truncatula]|uniref:Uncharacterized protein n=2 Tax=Medicago truncatula TaxID=3880 RepID=A0A072UYT0_MEDTR|nr:uncharacterized protein LOC25489453 [Medicago truncatula]KEH34929.1 hypothetical protein MTR_3g074450 [Medicago truncatula]
MVSLFKALSMTPRTEVKEEFESSRKRKFEEPFTEEFFKDQTNLEKRKSTFDTKPPLETMFPSNNWCQYLGIQSGQIQLCNTRPDRTTIETSKRSLRQPLSDHMSLDLELNLTCESQRKKENSDQKKNSGNSPKSLSEHDDLCIESSKFKKDSGGLNGSQSWLSTTEGDYKEMVATVCMQCHMLVMICKSSPACPNCKFMHSPDQNPSKFLKSRCSFFCSS